MSRERYDEIRHRLTYRDIRQGLSKEDLSRAVNRALDEVLAIAKGDRSPNRPFPIQQFGTIPWYLAEIVYGEYAKKYGGSQTLERLAERGGFGKDECDHIMNEKGWFDRNLAEHNRKMIEGAKRIADLEKELEEKTAEHHRLGQAFESIHNAIVFGSKDWAVYSKDAWIYGIVVGWDDSEGEATREICQRHKIKPEDLARMRSMHRVVTAAREALPEDMCPINMARERDEVDGKTTTD